MEREREPYLTRFRRNSSITVSTLMPVSGASSREEVTVPYQSLGSKGVRHLSSLIMQTTLPFNQPPGKARLPFDAELLRQRRPDLAEEILQRLAILDSRQLAMIDAFHVRKHWYKTIQYSLVGGNALLDWRQEVPRTPRFDQWCVRNDGRGDVLTLLLREAIPMDRLPAGVDPDEVARMMDQEGLSDSMPAIYTIVSRQLDGSYRMWQEVHAPTAQSDPEGRTGHPGVVAPESRQDFDTWLDSPFVLMPFDQADNKHYADAYIEYVKGDLLAYEGLSRAGLEGGIIASEQRFIVDASTGLRPEDLIRTRNGAFVYGKDGAISTMNSRDKVADLSWTDKNKDDLRQSLGEDFLLFTSVRREGERVTAQEQQFVANQLNASLGGPYSAMAVPQRHLSRIALRTAVARDAEARRQFEWFNSFGAPIEIHTVAGLEQIGREEEAQRQITFANVVQSTLGPEGFNRIAEGTQFARTLAQKLGMPDATWIRTQEEVAAIDRQQQQALLQQQAAGPVAGALVDAAADQLTQ